MASVSVGHLYLPLCLVNCDVTNVVGAAEVTGADYTPSGNITGYCCSCVASEAEALVGRASEAEGVVGRASEAEAVVTRVSEAEAVVRRASETETVVERASEAEAVVERASETEAVVERASEAEAVAEAVVGRVSEAEAVVGRASEAEAVVGRASEAEAVVERASEAEAVVAKASEAEAVVGKASEAEAVENQRTLAMEVSGKRSLPGGNRCEEHGLELESYCPSHGLLCCRDCVSHYHTDCDATTISEAARDGHNACNFDLLSSNLGALLANFESARHGEREVVRCVDNQGRELERRVKKFRENVNKMLDKLENSMILKKDEICGEERTILKKRIDVCDVAITCRLQNMEKKYKEVYEELVEGKGKFAIQFIPNDDLVQALESFGSINVKSTTKPTQLEEETLPDARLVKVAEIDVSAASDSTISTITGCVYLPDNRLVLADESNSCLKVVPCDDQEVRFVKKLEVQPWDLALLNETDIVLRCSSGTGESVNKLYVFTLSGDIELSKTVDVPVIDANGKSKRIIPKKKVLKEPQYIRVVPSQDRIYVSDFSTGIVALTLNGSVVFRKPSTHLDEFGGIAMDTNGCLFICAGKPYGIYRVSGDGSAITPYILVNSSHPYRALGRIADLYRALDRIADLYRALGRIAVLYRTIGRIADLYRAIGSIADVYRALDRIADLYMTLGRIADLYRALGRIADLYRALGRIADLYKALGRIADLYRALGRIADLYRALDRIADLYRALDDRVIAL
ncbi:DYHC2-like protein [Mya arenaria]|uniref:DYHC2-like protein n=1 Tax=Mya arenaria TaxID=6604 RepID=A0ABY7E7C6_MYAAR|nr:DYHC2-like protein [Mya arenaria]